MGEGGVTYRNRNNSKTAFPEFNPSMGEAHETKSSLAHLQATLNVGECLLQAARLV